MNLAVSIIGKLITISIGHWCVVRIILFIPNILLSFVTEQV